MYALVGNGLDAGCHVEWAELVGTRCETHEGLDRQAFAFRLAAVEVRRRGGAVDGVHHPIEADDL